MKIFIDTATGTWGDAEDIVIVEANQVLLDELNNSSDFEIVDKGGRIGKRLPFSLLHDYL